MRMRGRGPGGGGGDLSDEVVRELCSGREELTASIERMSAGAAALARLEPLLAALQAATQEGIEESRAMRAALADATAALREDADERRAGRQP